MRTIETDITIDAPPRRVWEILQDFAAYGEWNPFITRIEGELAPGARLDAHIRPAGRKPTRIRPTVTELEAGRRLAWLGSVGVRGIFDGDHRFDLEALGGGRTRLHHSERFSGIMVRPIMAMIGEATEAGFRSMNEALAERAEAA